MNRATLVIGLVALCCGSDIKKERQIEPLQDPKPTKASYIIYNERNIAIAMYSSGTNAPTLKKGYRYERVDRPDYSH